MAEVTNGTGRVERLGWVRRRGDNMTAHNRMVTRGSGGSGTKDAAVARDHYRRWSAADR